MVFLLQQFGTYFSSHSRKLQIIIKNITLAKRRLTSLVVYIESTSSKNLKYFLRIIINECMYTLMCTSVYPLVYLYTHKRNISGYKETKCIHI